MQFTLIESEYEIASTVAKKILDVVGNKPDAFLLLASGQSPTLSYNKVSDFLAGTKTALTSTKIHKLDEWEGLGFAHNTSCDSYLKRHVLTPWGIDLSNYSGVDATNSNLDEECQKANARLEENTPDLCILGIGINGHIGFNEPADALPVNTSIVDLTPTSMNHAMIKGAQDIKRGITTGIRQILRSKKIIVIVTGDNKKEILSKLMNARQLSTQLPASLLLLHNDVEVFYDAKAQ